MPHPQPHHFRCSPNRHPIRSQVAPLRESSPLPLSTSIPVRHLHLAPGHNSIHQVPRLLTHTRLPRRPSHRDLPIRRVVWDHPRLHMATTTSMEQVSSGTRRVLPTGSSLQAHILVRVVLRVKVWDLSKLRNILRPSTKEMLPKVKHRSTLKVSPLQHSLPSVTRRIVLRVKCKDFPALSLLTTTSRITLKVRLSFLLKPTRPRLLSTIRRAIRKAKGRVNFLLKATRQRLLSTTSQPIRKARARCTLLDQFLPLNLHTRLLALRCRTSRLPVDLRRLPDLHRTTIIRSKIRTRDKRNRTASSHLHSPLPTLIKPMGHRVLPVDINRLHNRARQEEEFRVG